MDNDPVPGIARAVARLLVSDYGPRLEVDVEAALEARHASRGAEQYDPVAIGALIVGIAQLAWMIYSDHRDKTPEITEHVIRDEIRREVEVTPVSVKIIDEVVKEIVQRPHGKPG